MMKIRNSIGFKLLMRIAINFLNPEVNIAIAGFYSVAASAFSVWNLHYFWAHKRLFGV